MGNLFNPNSKNTPRDFWIDCGMFFLKLPLKSIGISAKTLWRELRNSSIDWRFYPLGISLYGNFHYWIFYRLSEISIPLWADFILFIFLFYLTVGAVHKIKLRKLNGKIKNIGEPYSTDFTIVDIIPMDQSIKKLRVKTKTLSPFDIYKSKGRIETALNITIKDVYNTSTRYKLEIQYGDYIQLKDISYEKFIPHTKLGSDIAIGISSFGPITLSYKKMCHMMVAGETGGGKSSFLRQFITNEIIKKNATEFYLIDLKGGIEFRLFENIPNVQIAKDHIQAEAYLQAINALLDQRKVHFHAKKVIDFEAYNRKCSTKIPRIFIVIDECAELFGTKNVSPAEKISAQNARGQCSRLARLSRVFGIHLIIATQRPDTFVLDSQTNINMASRLCFRMNTHPASVTVLGDGSAMKLPHIPGRAFWKNGIDMMEVQIPFLTPEICEEKLTAFKSNISIQTSEKKSDADITKFVS